MPLLLYRIVKPKTYSKLLVQRLVELNNGDADAAIIELRRLTAENSDMKSVLDMVPLSVAELNTLRGENKRLFAVYEAAVKCLPYTNGHYGYRKDLVAAIDLV